MTTGHTPADESNELDALEAAITTRFLVIEVDDEEDTISIGEGSKFSFLELVGIARWLEREIWGDDDEDEPE